MSALPLLRLQRGPVLLAALVVYLLVNVTGLTLQTLQDLRQPVDVAYPDSANLYRIAQIAHTGELYPNFEQSPYLPTIYGPLFYILLSGVYRMAEPFGLPSTVCLRAVVLLFFLACVLLVFRIAGRILTLDAPAWLAALIAASGSILLEWTAQIRPDFMGLTFALCCVVLCLKAERRLVVLVAGLSAGLALLCKQTFVSAPSACLIWFLWRRQRIEAALLAGVALSVTLTGYTFFLWCEPATWQHLKIFAIPLNDNMGALYLLAKAAREISTCLLLLGYGVLWRRRTSQEGLLLIYVACAWLVAAFTVRHIGANLNYFFEPSIAGAPIAAAAAWRLHELRMHTPILVTAFVALLLASLTVPNVKRNLELVRSIHQQSKELPAKLKRWNEFRTALEGKRILSVFPYTAVWSSRPELLDPYLNHVLEKTGRWNPAPIVEDLRRRAYDVVMVPVMAGVYRGLENFSFRIKMAINHFYVPYCTWQEEKLMSVPGIVILLPKEERASVTGMQDELLQAGCRAKAAGP